MAEFQIHLPNALIPHSEIKISLLPYNKDFMTEGL